jgi:4'-phosphopantetheinyl transferase
VHRPTLPVVTCSDTWPELPPDEVHLWSASLAEPVGALSDLLSIDEIERRDRYVFPHLRARYARGRGLLRLVLGRYLDAPGASLRFAYGAHQKPAIVESELQFNLSHSGDQWLLAVSRDREVGVDIEATCAMDDFEAMARRYFAPGERQRLAALPPDQRLMAFYRGWTRKEAIMKATGEGLALALDAFEVTLAADDVRLLALRGEAQTPGQWSLQELMAPDGYVAALAVAGHGWRLRVFGQVRE